MNYKIILANKRKTLDENIKSYQVQYDLDRETANISALSSVKQERYEWFTKKDITLNPRTIETKQAKHSPLARPVTKGLKRSSIQDI